MSQAPRAEMVATLSVPPSPDGRELLGLPAAVGWLEVRADLVGDLDPDWLRTHFPGRLLYTLGGGAGSCSTEQRAVAGGGGTLGARHPESAAGLGGTGGTAAGGFAAASAVDPARRRERLLAAAERYDLVDLAGESDLAPELLARLPPERRLLSWRAGSGATASDLRRGWRDLARVAARWYRLECGAASAAEALAPLAFLRELGRADVTAHATGAGGCWTRLLAPRLGAPLVFGAVLPGLDGDGALGAAQLAGDYGLPELHPVRHLYGIVGPAAARSLSPRLHNHGYRVLRLPALYLSFPTASLEDFLAVLEPGLAALGMPLRGLTVAAPHKEAALAAAATASPLASRAGAANTLVHDERAWHADTADARGVVAALAARGIGIAGRQAAVVGCGGAGRAAALGLHQAGARVTLINRGRERGEWAERLLGLPVERLAGFSPHGYSLVVNATPCGWTNGAAAPFPLDRQEAPGTVGGAVLVDLPYGPEPTPLVAAAAALGWTVIDGREVLLIEAHHQFELMTGRSLPPGSMAAALAPTASPSSTEAGVTGVPATLAMPAASAASAASTAPGGDAADAAGTAGAGAMARLEPTSPSPGSPALRELLAP